ncbi:hypothetical protein V6N13_027145 [Hibiscus sabdariffa]
MGFAVLLVTHRIGASQRRENVVENVGFSVSLCYETLVFTSVRVQRRRRCSVQFSSAYIGPKSPIVLQKHPITQLQELSNGDRWPATRAEGMACPAESCKGFSKTAALRCSHSDHITIPNIKSQS